MIYNISANCRRQLAGGSALLVGLLLGGCGGGGSSAAVAPSAAASVPDSAYASTPAFMAFIASMSPNDHAEPLLTSNATAPTDDHAEPWVNNP